MKATLPVLEIGKCINHSPHVVILGAGATRACIPSGDANGRPAPLMLDFVQMVGLDEMLSEARVEWRGLNFEAVYDSLYYQDPESDLIRAIEASVWDYFTRLELPPQPTVYDYLLASLRDKDLIATFNWDPLLAKAYRRNTELRRLPKIVFLHGNVAIGVCRVCRVKGWRGESCQSCGGQMEDVRLLYPVAEKDYTSDSFIQSEWNELRAALRHAYFLTVFGYGAPGTDAAAVSLMREVWSQNTTNTLAEVELIDVKPRDDLLASWQGFITRQHYITRKNFETSYCSWHPRRSCEALAFATLQNDPWPDNWLPHFGTLAELQAWVGPIVEEEDRYHEDGAALTRHGLPCS